MLARLPIKVSAPVIIGLPALALGVLLSIMWYSQSRQAVTELADQNIEQIHELASNKIADVLSVPVRLCEINEHQVSAGQLDPEDLHAWRPALVRQARAFDMLSAIVWGGADGQSAWISRYADGNYYWAVKDDPTQPLMKEWRLDADDTIPDEPTNTFDFDLFVRPWFVTPREAGEPTWSDPFVWVGGVDSEGVTLGISYGIPMTDDDGEFIGVIDADYSLNDLSAFLRSIEIGTTGLAVLTDAEGRMLASSAVVPIVDDDLERIDVRRSPDPLVAAAARRMADAIPGSHAEFIHDGEVHYLRTSSVGLEVGLNWMLTTVIPERDFTANIESEFRRSSLTSLLVVLLTLIVGLIAARWLVAPILTLVNAVRQIGQGELETRVDINHAPEYRHLADEINEMTVGLQDRLRMRESLSLAMEVQRNLLPAADPNIEGLDIAGHSTYCDETGGDYYDFLDVTGVEDDTAVVALGDVMGHGVAAAMLMATARGILRSRCAVPGSLADFLEHLNDMLVPDTRGQRFMTMLLLTISPNRREMRWSSAGHGPPIVYDSINDRYPDLDGGDLPLGIVGEEHYEEFVKRDIGPGYVILAATDGLWEAKGADGELYGMDRLRELLRTNAHRPAAEIGQEIRRTLNAYVGPEGQDDDLTFVIIKVLDCEP